MVFFGVVLPAKCERLDNKLIFFRLFFLLLLSLLCQRNLSCKICLSLLRLLLSRGRFAAALYVPALVALDLVAAALYVLALGSAQLDKPSLRLPDSFSPARIRGLFY